MVNAKSQTRMSECIGEVLVMRFLILFSALFVTDLGFNSSAFASTCRSALEKENGKASVDIIESLTAEEVQLFLSFKRSKVVLKQEEELRRNGSRGWIKRGNDYVGKVELPDIGPVDLEVFWSLNRPLRVKFGIYTSPRYFDVILKYRLPQGNSTEINLKYDSTWDTLHGSTRRFSRQINTPEMQGQIVAYLRGPSSEDIHLRGVKRRMYDISVEFIPSR